VFSKYSEDVLGISRYDYFNAGILVMNLKEMRTFEIEKRFAEILSERIYRVAQDQDYLNKLCHGRVRLLPLCWNKTPMPYSDRNEIPKIAHYKINYKPWKYDNIPYGELFWEYAARTPLYKSLLDAKNAYTDAEKAQVKELFQKAADLNSILDKYDIQAKYDFTEYLAACSQYFDAIR
jgi:lipopolysaccharide biosynthesis glycosyltransferase